MKTPAGTECKYYYEDFNRGRSRQECRLIAASRETPAWKPSDCKLCEVPRILWANASENLELHVIVRRGFLGFGRRIVVRARCRKHSIDITDPYVGCELCSEERQSMLPTIGDENE